MYYIPCPRRQCICRYLGRHLTPRFHWNDFGFNVADLWGGLFILIISFSNCFLFGDRNWLALSQRCRLFGLNPSRLFFRIFFCQSVADVVHRRPTDRLLRFSFSFIVSAASAWIATDCSSRRRSSCDRFWALAIVILFVCSPCVGNAYSRLFMFIVWKCRAASDSIDR